MNYECSLIANLKGNKIVIGLKINVPIFLLCPCSLAICRNGAHNQRGIVNLLIIPHKNDWFGDFINLVEKAGSAELYSILKRSDEKFLIDSATEKAFFVEDVARNIIVILKKNGYNSYRLEVKSFESIHNHNIYSRIGLNENELPS
jgi:GTP cyclohydrolase I